MSENLDSRLIHELYDPKELGVIVMKQYLTEDAVVEAQKIGEAVVFTPMPGSYGRARQAYEEALLLPRDLVTLRLEYEHLAREIGRHAGFSTLPNAYRFNRYAEGSLGIQMHRDILRQINLVMIGIIYGQAPFHVAKNLEDEPLELELQPKDLLLMRAPRGPQERYARPYHSVGTCQTPRMSVIARYELPDYH